MSQCAKEGQRDLEMLFDMKPGLQLYLILMNSTSHKGSGGNVYFEIQIWGSIDLPGVLLVCQSGFVEIGSIQKSQN